MSLNRFAAPTQHIVARCSWSAIRFSAVSVGAFAIWALEDGWFKRHGGEPAMYAMIALFFLGASGAVLHPLLGPAPGSRWRFYRAFVPAFFVYALVWSAAWFAWGAGSGEWLGSAGGALAMVVVARRLLGWKDPHRVLVMAVLGFLLLHNAGYFAGGKSMAWLMERSRSHPRGSDGRKAWIWCAKLSWGLFFGLGVGAGFGLVFRAPSVQGTPANSEDQPKASIADS